MNTNIIKTNGFSSPESEASYKLGFATDPAAKELYDDGSQCGGCSFFAPLNADYGLCCHPGSKHCTETVFEHFTCAKHVAEGWGCHSFTSKPSRH